MKRIFLLIALIVSGVSCSEKIDLTTGKSEVTFLAVEAMLNNLPDTYQVVKLTESVPYLSDEPIATPVVSGATVKIVCEGNTVEFKETEWGEPGCYYSPEGFCGEVGRTYSLLIERKDKEGNQLSYSASSTMRESGCVLEKIDYKLLEAMDSTWVIGIWAEDLPGPSNYLATFAVNGYSYPLENSFAMGDKYFDSAVLEGFPVAVLTQTEENRKAYGPCAKAFEEGDVLTLTAYTLSDDAYEFISSVQKNASSVSIPIISSQPANTSCNIKGDPAVGYFIACPAARVSRVVDDPYRIEYKEEDATVEFEVILVP